MIIKDVKIINHNHIIENADIEIDGEIILRIKPKAGRGKHLLIPGFIDTHIHGYRGFDVMDSQEAVEKISKELVKKGVTSFVPTVMSQEWSQILSALKNIAKSQNRTIVAINLEGPFISRFKKGAHNEKYLIKPTVDNIIELSQTSEGLLRKITFAPEEIENLEAIITTMQNCNIIPSIGHTNSDSATIEKAINYGANSVTHLWNAMSGVQNRHPGVAQIFLNHPEVWAEIICDFIHVDIETMILTINAKLPKKLLAVSDAIRPSDCHDGDYEAGSLTVTKKGEFITLKNSETLAGASGTIYNAFKNLTTLLNHPRCHLTMTDVVAMTSYNAAQHFNLSKIGEVKVQNFADLIILNHNYEIITVISKGQKVTLS